MKPAYLFICREGSSDIFTSDLAPTKYDIEAVKVGVLEVIRLADLARLNDEGKWEPVKEGELATVEVDGEVRGPFHASVESR